MLVTETPRRSEFANRGWVILALASLTAALTGPGQTIGVSVFIDFFVDDLDLSRSQVSGAYLVGTLMGAALLPRIGRFVDARGVRIMQVSVGLLFALALVNMSFVNGLVWLAIGFAGIRFLGQGSLSLVANVTVALSFTRQRGTAIGIFATVTSGLMALVPVGLNSTIDAVGWRQAWLIAAAFVACTVVPIGWFGLRSLPTGEHRPATPDPAPPDPATLDPATLDPMTPDPATLDPMTTIASTGVSGDHVDGSYTRSEALRTRSFWMLAAVSGAAGMMGTALNFHQIDLMGEAGISAAGAAALFIPQVAGSTLAGLVVGVLSDRFGTRFLPPAGMALLVLAHLLAAVVEPGVVAIVYAVVLGAMGGAVRTAASTLLPSWFGTGHLGSIQGLLSFFNVASSAVGPVALAVARAGFGSYAPAVLLLSSIPGAALLFSLRDDSSSLRPVAH